MTLTALLFAAIWGVVALFFRPIGDYGVETDFYGDFAHYARQWMSGEPTLMNGFRGPLYYIVLGLLAIPFGDAFLAGKVLSVVSAALGLWFAGDLARRLFGRTAGIAAAIAIAANLTLMEYAYRACSDLFYWGLFAGAVWLLFKEETETARSRIWAGALAGAAWLTRYNGAALVPAGLLAALAVRGSPRQVTRRAVLFLGAFAVVILPWSLYVWSQTGDPFWNRNYENVAVEVLVEKPDMAAGGGFMSAIDFRSVGDVYRVWPARFIGALVHNAGSHLVSDARRLVGLPWAIAGVAGFLLAFRSWSRRRGLLFMAAGLATYLSLIPVFYNPRFMLTLLVWWAAGAGMLAERLSVMLDHPRGEASPHPRERPSGEGRARAGRAAAGPARSRGRNRAALGLTVLYAAAALATTIYALQLTQGPKKGAGLPTEILEVARAARATGARFDDTTPIAARKPHIGYYLRAPVVSIPAGQLDQLADDGVRYLLVSGAEVNVLPGLSPLWNPKPGTPIPREISMVAQGRVTDRQGKTVRAATLYSVKDPAPYTRPDPSPFRQPPAPPPGLSRGDHLRLQLVRWYVRWDSKRDAEAVLRLISPSALDRADVLLARADVAFERKDLGRAADLYRRVLDSEPRNRRAALALAGIAYLRNDNPERDRWLGAALGGSAEAPLDSIRAAAAQQFRSRDFATALAPTSVLIESDPAASRARVTMAYILQGIGREDEARAVARDFLKDNPGDREAAKFLGGAR